MSHLQTNPGDSTSQTSFETPTPDLEEGIIEKQNVTKDDTVWNWDDDPNNPYNWPTRAKVLQVLMIGSAAFTT